MLASAVLTRASLALQDADFVRWSVAEMLGYLNQGQQEIAAFKPNASVTCAAVQLVQGTRQSLPNGGLMLIDVTRNMGPSGSTPGAAIRLTSRGILDAQVPNWHTSAQASATVQHYVYTPLDPTRFYVYPPQPAVPEYVELIYGVTPTDVEANADPTELPTGSISIADIYAPALHDYILYRAYSKDAEYAANAALAELHYKVFLNHLQGKASSEKVFMPTKGAA